LDKDELPDIRVQDAHTFTKDLEKASAVFAVTIDKIGEVEEVPLPLEFLDYKDVVASSSITDRPLPDSIEHTINIELRARPPFQPLYNLSNQQLEVLQEYLSKAQKNG